MDADTRSALLREVTAIPGASTRILAQRVGSTEWTADYHLRRLARSGAVTGTVSGRERVWFATSCGYCPVLRAVAPALRRAEAVAVARAADRTPASVPQLAQRANVAPGTARWVASVLCEAFVFERTRLGRLVLREGASTCVERAASGRGCDLWGKCSVSRAWAQEGKGTPVPVVRQARP